MLSEPVSFVAVNSNNDYVNHQGWKANLDLGFIRGQHKTLLSKRSHYGPLTVQRPFYPEAEVCHVYILHPPGGIVGGDQLTINVHVDKGAEALITTPGAGKIYRSERKQAVQKTLIKVNNHASLEWLPQETIVFEGAQLVSDVRIELETNARFIGWEIVALGRPAAGEGFMQGEVFLNWQIYRNKSPLFLEKMRIDSETFVARWGLNQYSSFGSFFAVGASTVCLEAVREMIGDSTGMGVTLIDDLLICRATAHKTAPIRQFFESVRAIIRPDTINKPGYTPRIWAT